MTGMKMKDVDGETGDDMDENDDIEELDPSCCFMCDLDHDTIESCSRSIFYKFIKSYVDEKGTKLAVAGNPGDSIELGNCGSELTITRTTDRRILTKTLGSREFLRYYRQKPRPTNYTPLTAALASRYRSMGLATIQSREGTVRMKVLKAKNRSGVKSHAQQDWNEEQCDQKPAKERSLLISKCPQALPS